MMDIEAYLERIGYTGARDPTVETLRQLHRAHICSVPFENLDLFLGHPIDLSLSFFYNKIVRNRRGGGCYTLNGLFGWLLEQLGFKVAMLSARKVERGQLGPQFGHLLLLIQMEKRLIADVGAGDSFLEPLALDTDEENVQHGCSYRLKGSASGKILQRRCESDWKPIYIFSLTPRRLAEFSPMLRHHSTPSKSPFARQALCLLTTTSGRIMLLNNHLIVTTGRQNRKRLVKSEEEYKMILKTRFGIKLGEGERVDKLMNSTPPYN